MADDEFRLCDGEVRKCSLVTGTLVNAAPGQRERVEKWRASKEKKEAPPFDPVGPGKVYQWKDVEITISGLVVGKAENVICEFKHKPQPLGENELERLDGTRESIKAVCVYGWTPCVCDNYPWEPNTNLAKSFVPGSVDRAKRIFARLYEFRDDEGVDPSTGKLRTMAINEARNPETGEIVRLTSWTDRWSGRRFGHEMNAVGAGEVPSISKGAKWERFVARCIAYRDHVLKLEKELEELK